jgi:hypothetical protein
MFLDYGEDENYGYERYPCKKLWLHYYSGDGQLHREYNLIDQYDSYYLLSSFPSIRGDGCVAYYKKYRGKAKTFRLRLSVSHHLMTGLA